MTTTDPGRPAAAVPWNGIRVAMVLSGAAALVYETVWARALSCHMGGTAQTVALVLAAFMGGMALGSWWAGRLADTSARPLRLYGLLELSLACVGAAMPWLIPVVGGLYADLAVRLGPGPHLLALRGLLFLILLSIPAIVMGATFPLACRAAVTTAGEMPGRISSVYAANTAGALVGCVACGVALIPWLGITRSSITGACLNVAAGLLGLALSGRMAPIVHEPESRGSAGDPPGEPAGAGSPAPPGADDPFVAALPFHLLVSGFTAMAYEVLFTRLLPLVIGASTYSFTVMLAAFIAGITRGAWALARLDVLPARRVLARCQLRLGLTILLSLPLLPAAPFAYAMVKGFVAPPFPVFLAIVFGLAFVVMSYPAYHLGMVIPAASLAMARDVRAMGRAIGRAYLANTVGNVAGSLACGLFLLPGLGMHRAFVVMALFNIASGLCLHRFLGGPLDDRFKVGLGLALIVTLAFGRFHPALTAGGAFRTARDPQVAVAQIWTQGAYPIVFEKDDVNTTVVVQRTAGPRPSTFLKVSGKVDASDSSDMHTQLMLAHLPLGLAPRPDRVLVIGLGSGVTAGAALTHPVAHVDAAELSDGVVAATRFFAHVNGRYWDDPRLAVVVDDARHHLVTTRRTYDVMISEPSNPWMAGIVNLYTREFFELAAARLSPDGLFCQWIHTYEISSDVLRMIVRTFGSVFGHVRVFLTGTGADVLILGCRKPIEPAEAAVTGRWSRPGVRESLARLGIHRPLTPLVLEVFGETEVRAFAGDGPLVTDDRPILEYEAPKAFYRDERALLPVVENFRSPDHLWCRWRPGARVTADEISEIRAYGGGVVPAQAVSSLAGR